MNSDKVILSMTTWAPRRDTILKVWDSLLVQVSSIVHPVLVIAYEDYYAFLNEAKILTTKGVEIIYSPNYKSHKKLIPTLQRYPNNPILVIDDDNILPEGWLETFLQDHHKHPTDIIYGQANSEIIVKNNVIEDRLFPVFTINPGKVTLNLKPSSGAAGTLYPPNTFTNADFMDESLFMRLSPTCDESWQFAHAVMLDRTFRCLSSHNLPKFIKTNQDCALCNYNRYHWSEIHNRIAEYYPDYLEKMKIRNGIMSK